MVVIGYGYFGKIVCKVGYVVVFIGKLGDFFGIERVGINGCYFILGFVFVYFCCNYYFIYLDDGFLQVEVKGSLFICCYQDVGDGYGFVVQVGNVQLMLFYWNVFNCKMAIKIGSGVFGRFNV